MLGNSYPETLVRSICNNLHLTRDDLIHFVGIGGIGMSGIARIFRKLGLTIQGSDLIHSSIIQQLNTLDIPASIGHNAQNIGNAKLVIRSSAIPDDNPEILAARDRNIPVISRAESLAALMTGHFCITVAGSHGKTTTTAMIYDLLKTRASSPTLIAGGIIRAIGTNAKLGYQPLSTQESSWPLILVESDESDGSFISIPTNIGVLTNIDSDHMSHYGGMDSMKEAFCLFINKAENTVVLNLDNHNLVDVLEQTHQRGFLKTKKIITYSKGAKPRIDGAKSHLHLTTSDMRTTHSGMSFDLLARQYQDIGRNNGYSDRLLTDINIPMHGLHNLENALAAIGAAISMEVPFARIREGLENFGGVERRYTKITEVNGVSIIDDYAHHPTEIAATIASAKLSTLRRVLAVFQPHRVTRLANLMDEFVNALKNADEIWVLDIYAAGEKSLTDITSEALCAKLMQCGKSARYLGQITPKKLRLDILSIASDGDTVLFMGAGNITEYARYFTVNELGHT